MKILLIHNKYKQKGGEDSVFQSESELLKEHGHIVDHLVFDNSTIKSWVDKILSGLRLIYNPTSARLLRIKIEAFQPHVIHIHNFILLASPAVFFVAKKFHVPVVMTLHNYRLVCPSATLFYKGKIYEKSINSFFPMDAILKGVYRNSRVQTAAVAIMTAIHSILGTWRNKIDLYIALSHFAKEKFLASSLAMPESRFLVKPNSVIDYGTGETVRKDFFLFVGRLVEDKGILTLLQATMLQNFKLIIIGEGPLQDLVIEHAQHNSNIQYLGFQEKDTVIRYMKTCRALIFPSIWYEGFPITILEAFSTGTVVLASNIGSMAEIIENKVNGIHFEAGNAQDLACKISEISGQSISTRKISEIARLSYLEYYTPEANYRALLKAYRIAIAKQEQAEARMAKNKISQRFEPASNAYQ
jgi:glycosyltransferase involved in cell wall biosynthesis